MNKREEKLGIVLLGAGNSKRFGGRKQFYEIEGEMMYLKMIRKLNRIPNTECVLVTQFEEMKDQVKGFEIVINHNPEDGISHSISLGIKALLEKREPLSGMLFAVCDQPYLKIESIERLVKEYRRSCKKIACLSYKETMGNPVIFHLDYVDELLSLTGDIGGKKVVKKHMTEVLFVEVKEEKELFDIDYKQDIEK